MPEQEPFAYFGGLLATRLVEVSTDPAVLDGSGWWAVQLTYENEFVAARFADINFGPHPNGSWPGVDSAQWGSSMSREEYVAAVSSVRESIARGDVYQANICRVLTTTVSQQHEIAALGALLQREHPSPHGGSIVLPGHEVAVISASPELFLRREGDVIESSPIKGTAQTPESFLEKDSAENVMIVDLVRNDIGQVSEPGSIEVPSLLSVESHPGLAHLVSTVRGRLRPGVGWRNILSATFPPGSVTGAPKSSALRIISDLEQAPRGPYCGAIGWVDADKGQAELAVGIRTFWQRGDSLHFGTGAGITWGSDPAQEWDETGLKARRLLEVAAQSTSS